MKHIAVILSGCGFLDGAEIRESVLTLLALDTQGARYTIFAPDKDQHHVVDHVKGEEVAEASRNVLVEAARIARGDIHDVATLKAEDFDALIMPGGFGVAKNLSSFAFEGSAASVDETVARVVKSFKGSGKPIGAICIAPAFVALVCGGDAPTLTIGTDADIAGEIEKLGAQHQDCQTDDCVIDEAHKIVTTPAYMDGAASLSDVHSGISKLVSAVLKLA